MKITIDTDKIKYEDNKIIIDDAELSSLLKSTNLCKSNVKLSELKAGEEFKIDTEVFIVLDKSPDMSGTYVIAKDFVYQRVKFGKTSNWKESPIRGTLNGEYLMKIYSIIGEENVYTMHRNLTSLDGLDDYGICKDRVSLLTAAEYAKYHKILGLKPNYPDWWWLITPASTPSNDYSRFVCFVGSGGVLDWGDCCCGVRPFLYLNSSMTVETM